MWTNAQQQAISQKGNILVSASAGTGKTAVLTEKVVKTVIGGINIDEMVIMTFSQAAAAQMKDRIKKRIREVIDDPATDRVLKNMLWKQLRRFGDSHIQTIHSFCAELIRKYFYVIGIDPNVRVADVFDTETMKMKAADKVMEPEYAISSDDFKTLEGLIDSTETIERVIIQAYTKISSFVNYREWIAEAAEKYNISGIPSFMVDMVVNDFSDAAKKYEVAIKEIEDGNDGDPKLDKIINVFNNDLNLINGAIQKIQTDASGVGRISSILPDFGATVRFPAGGDLEGAKALRNKARDIVNSYVKNGFDFNVQAERVKAMYPAMKKMQAIIERFDDVYTKMKSDARVIDFNDMEKFAYRILQDDAVSIECKSLYRMVFIDEYQDTNPIQEAIIERISNGSNLFCVGDLKQSIYRFRSSDPTLFSARSKQYMARAVGAVINLNQNFRSAQNVLSCANDVFDYITNESEEISYTEDDALVHGRSDDNSVVPVDVQVINEGLRGTDGLTLDEIEVYNLVKIIKENVGKMIYDPETGENRPIQYKDIVILSRKLSGLTDYMAQIFSANDIPYTIERAGELFETMEIKVLMAVIKLINNPKNDLELVTLMHLGVFGFCDSDIVAIKKGVKSSYYDYMTTISELDSPLSLKCRALFDFLNDCRGKQKYLSVSAILDEIIRRLELNDIFMVMRNGQQKVANIREFQQHARDYEKKYAGKLHGFETYLNNIIAAGVPVGEAVVSFEENSVTVTTIHKSKGLEYPVVILAFAGKAFSKMDRRANVVVDKDAGIGIKYYNHIKKEKGKCILRTYIENVIDDKGVEEEMRLLYVAMTRAKEKLYIQGTSAEGKQYDLKESGCFLDWVMSTIANSVDFADVYGGYPDVKLTGSWTIETVDYADLRGYFFNEANETPLNELIDKYKVTITSSEDNAREYKTFVPLSMSASGRIGIYEPEESMLTIPDFMKPEYDPLYAGTVAHEFLKYADLRKMGTQADINGQKKALTGTIKEEDMKYVNARKLEKFFNTDLGRMIRSSDSFIKEKYVSIIVNSSDVGYGGNEDILARCIVDLIFIRDGKYYLVDYKTDRIENPDSDEDVNQAAMKHHEQLMLYCDALNQMYGIIIEKAYVAFINAGVYAEA